MAGEPKIDETVDHLKSQFLASLNHEIRTPLSGIIGMTELLLETSLDGEQREYVAATKVCAESLLEMLNATLEYSALAAGTPVLDEYEFNLAETLDVPVAEHAPRARAKGLRLYLTCGENVPETIIGDARRFRQMLSQLIGNAVKFTNEGHIEVVARLDAPGLLSIEVRDTGIGIPREKLDIIFESFRQADAGLARSHSGLGLGLALAQRIARLLGGGISAASIVGVGSTFTARIPIRVPQPVQDAAAMNGSSFAAKFNVLVVEDNRVSQTVITHLLRRHGIAVHSAMSGIDALQAAGALRFDLVLMDLQMPEMDGLETTVRLRNVPGYADVPVVALTANYSDAHRELAKQHGMQAFLSKPVQSTELIATLKKFLGQDSALSGDHPASILKSF